MKRTLILAVLLLAATSLNAAPPPPPPGPPPHERELLPPPAFAEFLALTEAQKAQAEQLHRALRDTIEPLIEQRASREQIEAAHDAFRKSFAALLTSEQRAKFDVYEEIRTLRERSRRERE